MLARREHSAFELRRKLQQHAIDDAEIDAAIERLQQEGLQSDQRFAEAYVDMRMSRGYGPQRIALELKERGVAERDFRHYLYNDAIDWNSVMDAIYRKKYGGRVCEDYQDKVRRMRYLQYRGFAHEMIHELLDRSSKQ